MMKKITLIFTVLVTSLSFGQIILVNSDFQTYPFLSGGGWGIAGSGITHSVTQGTIDPRAGGDGKYCVLKITSTGNSGNYKQFHNSDFTIPGSNQQYGLKFWAKGVSSTTEELQVSILYKFAANSTNTKSFLIDLTDTW